jgi:hypothetical protein
MTGSTVRNSGTSDDITAIEDKNVTGVGSQSGTWTCPITANVNTSIISFKAPRVLSSTGLR